MTTRADPSAHDAVQRSRKHRGSRNRLLVLGGLVLLMAGCVSRPSLALADLPHFGERLPGTIEITVQTGFKRPGVYHLPGEATLGLLVDVAELEPVNEPFWVRCYVAHFLVIRNDRPYCQRERNISTDDGISKAERALRLRDGDRIQTGCLVW